MHGEAVPLGHVVVHNAEDTLLHLASVGGAKNDLLLGGEVHIHSVLALDVGQLSVGAEFTRVEDGEVGPCLEIFLDFLLGRALKHLLHKQSVVGSGRNDSCLQVVTRVPSSVLVNHKDALAHVQEIDGTRFVEVEALRAASDIHGAPVHFLKSVVVRYAS